MLRQTASTITIDTRGRGLFEITTDIFRWVLDTHIGTGLLTLFLRHTSASLLIQENADPDVRADLDRFFARLVPDGDALFRHRDEGPDDMPAHVRAALTSVQLSIPVSQGRPVLGMWQGIYLWETNSGHTSARWRCICWVSRRARDVGAGPRARGCFDVDPVSLRVFVRRGDDGSR